MPRLAARPHGVGLQPLQSRQPRLQQQRRSCHVRRARSHAHPVPLRQLRQPLQRWHRGQCNPSLVLGRSHRLLVAVEPAARHRCHTGCHMREHMPHGLLQAQLPAVGASRLSLRPHESLNPPPVPPAPNPSCSGPRAAPALRGNALNLGLGLGLGLCGLVPEPTCLWVCRTRQRQCRQGLVRLPMPRCRRTGQAC